MNKNSILRLSRYRNALNRLKNAGLVKIFSDYLADAVGVTSSQVRKDFSLFGIAGNKRGGYKIDALLEKLNTILGKNVVQPVVLVGAGNIGSALIKYKGFEKEGIRIVAAFDSEPAKIRPAAKVPILPVAELAAYVKANSIKIAIISVPESVAQQVFDTLRAAGISGFLNFAPLRLRSDNNCVVNNVNLELELENVIYFVNVFEKSGIGIGLDKD
ncbi:MAG: redox-sensing transcriptional repressor Rex [Chitinivibrionales bacterium]|nr:redox-sensing transcriptional repressor Rex [Chitinivibrionales bacterium]